MTTFIRRLVAGETPAGALRVAVKDAIDVAGVPTTVGCAAVADNAVAAESDAACLAGVRAAGDGPDGAVIVGKTNLHELCFGITGINPWYGTPVNPLDATRIPGGSSSGSAVAVAAGEADVGLGTDTGGSVRIPAACCGIVGLKTTWGRVPLDGVWPLSPALDTVGPLASDVAAVERGMALLEAGFRRADAPARTIRRLRISGVDEVVDRAVDEALRAAGYKCDDVVLDGWEACGEPFLTIIAGEAYRSNREVLEGGRDRIGADVARLLDYGSQITDQQLADAIGAQDRWAGELHAAVDDDTLLALPTLASLPPTHDDADASLRTVRLTPHVNLARVPAISLPVPSGDPLPASLQLIGPMHGEALLVGTAAVVEAAVRRI